MSDLERIERAMYATANRLGGGTLTWTDDWVQLTTPDAETDYRNIVYLSVLAEDAVDARISKVVQQHRELGVAFRWWTTPTTRPTDMGQRLIARDFVHVDDVEGMVADAQDFPEPARADIRVTRVNLETMDEWLDTTTAGWGMPPAGRERFRIEVEQALSMPEPTVHYFVARLGDALAGASSLTCLDGFAHFSGAVVIPEHRKRGIYREMVLERMRYLRSIGLRDVTNTCVKSTSAPICARLGFHKVCDTQIYRHAGGSESLGEG